MTKRACGAALGLALLVIGLPPPGAAVAGTHATAPYATVTNATVTHAAAVNATARRRSVEREPTPAELAQERITVARLKARIEQQAQDVAHARQALQATAALAGQALEASATAVRALQVSQGIEEQRQDALAAARHRVAAGRRELGQWVRQAYQGGAELSASPTMTVLLSADGADDLGTGLTVLRRMGHEHSQNLDDVVAAQAGANAAADAAAQATQKAAADAVAATNARREADAAVALQRRLLGQDDSALAAAQAQLSVATRRQEQSAAAAGNAGGLRQDNRVTGDVGDCAGGDDVAQYANGQIPLSALCPLQADPRQHLRADAAYAFDRLTFGYAQEFGRAPCITDSYRSYAEQVDVYARKPGLAAVPGTSNHGWGTALDLCGGIESFTSPQHRWMLLNAPLYGWFHPSWAEPTGSRPEPWHWEYAG